MKGTRQGCYNGSGSPGKGRDVTGEENECMDEKTLQRLLQEQEERIVRRLERETAAVIEEAEERLSQQIRQQRQPAEKKL